jgi:hypothetical protein
MDAMGDFFDRMMRTWQAAGRGLPRLPWDPDVDQSFYQSAPDASEWSTWRPVKKSVRHDLAALAPDLGPIHPSIDAYVNSFWFGPIDGHLGPWALTLEPILPGLELDSLLAKARGYAAAHGGRLDHVPIGIELDGLQVVVDNRTGEVAIEDWERGTFETIAPSLDELFSRLQP